MIDSRRLARRLLSPEDQELVGGYSPNPEIIDRASLLPIGQYEDGSLTLAWPGFVKDAFEGAARTYLDAGSVPVPDAAPGTKWAGNLDGFNAASIGPISGIAGRAAGLAYGPTRDAFLAEHLMRKFPDEGKYAYAPEGFWGAPAYAKKSSQIAAVDNRLRAPASNDTSDVLSAYDVAALSQAWRSKVKDTGEFFANDANAALPALLGSGQDDNDPMSILQRYGLLEPPAEDVPRPPNSVQAWPAYWLNR